MPTDPAELQASHWLAKLDAAGPTPELLEAIRAWRELDSLNEAAFLRLQAVWTRLDQLHSTQPSSSVATDTLVDRRAQPSMPRRAAFGRGIRGWAVAASVLVVCMLLVGTWNEHSERYATAIGGFERVVLRDGSIVEINTDSEIRVSLDQEIRRVEFIKGEALFTVAADPNRPFVVTVGGAAVRAVGTQFNVHRLDEQVTEVLVTEGKVAVTSGRQTMAVPLVSAGQMGLIARGAEAVVRTVPPAQLNRELAWTSGMLVFAGEPLREAILELNRYNTRLLEIEDPNVAALTIGGYFNARNLDGFIAVLESHFGVEAVATGERIVLRRAPEPN